MYTSRLKRLFALTISGLLTSVPIIAQPSYQSDEATVWADSLLSNMTLEEKVGQMFMVAAYSNRNAQHERELTSLISDYHIGGLIFFQGGPVRQANMTNRLQAKADIPLMIGMDAEWDLAMRLDSVAKLPWPMTLGATDDSSLAYAYGQTIARHCKRLGVHFNFGPVLDINTNPENPIIGVRAFGEDAERVSRLGVAYMLGMQDAGVLACGKHFPGHGDTHEDSHQTLPTVDQSYTRLHEVEWEPYRRAFDNGLASVMIAHLNVPSLDNTGMPTSLSPIVVDSLLRVELGFDGLSFTDALNMRGVSSRYEPGDVDLRALKAGNDVLLFAENVPVAMQKIVAAVNAGDISEEEIDVHVRRILMAKHGAGLSNYRPISTQSLFEDLNDRQTEVLISRIYDHATTVVTNQDRILPLDVNTSQNISVVNMGNSLNSDLYQSVLLYTSASNHTFNGNNANAVLRDVATSDLVILGYTTDNANPWRRFAMTDIETAFLQRLLLQNRVIFVHFANPYGLRTAGDIHEIEAVIQAYQNTPDAARSAAQIIFGAQPAVGSLPVTIGPLLRGGYGIHKVDMGRLRYGHPEEVGVDPSIIERIDAEVNNAIEKGATPGAQVLVARNGVVIYHKAIGQPIYNARTDVQTTDLYDIASITKIAASLPMIMRMYDDGRLNLEDELGEYLPEVIGTNKEHLKLIDILTHQSGLQAWIPFYTKTLQTQQPDPAIYHTEYSEEYPLQVAEGMYMLATYEDTMYREILESPITNAGDYRYSDLGYYFFKRIIEEEYKAPLEDLIQEELYAELGGWSLGYNPLEHFDESAIIPSERDQYFRYQTIQGYVHDQGAAMLGGVGGHAGVFSNANDLAKLMQMYLNRGEYGGHRYFRTETIDLFTRCPFCLNENRRGIGFDKPQLEGAGPSCDCASPKSFGHTGFTGTMAWVDPEEELVFIFLSNRVYPSAENRKLISMNVRTNIQEIIYDSIIR